MAVKDRSGGPNMTSENRTLYFSQSGCIISLSVTNQDALFLQQQQQFQMLENGTFRESENRSFGESDFQRIGLLENLSFEESDFQRI